jgi:hypothetical protein
MPKNKLYPMGVPIDTSRPTVSTGTGHLGNPSDMKQRKPSKGGQGMNAGKGSGHFADDGLKRSHGSIDNARPSNHANPQGLKAKKSTRVRNPFGVPMKSPSK